MNEELLKKVYSIQEKNEKEYVLSEKPESELNIKFLAKNPKDGELFLLLGDHGSYSLLKGNAKEGLKFCRLSQPRMFADCFALPFDSNDSHGVITDPDSKKQNPVFIPDLEISHELEIVSCTIEIEE